METVLTGGKSVNTKKCVEIDTVIPENFVRILFSRMGFKTYLPR